MAESTDWKSKYAGKVVTAAEAVSHIRPGNKIFIFTGCAAPQALIEALTEGKSDVSDAEIYHLLTMGVAPYARERFSQSYRFNSFFISEFAISPKTLGEIRRGEDMCIYQYVRVIRCMTKYLHLIIQLDMLLKELRIVLSSHCDLVVATVPHRSCGTCQPTEWVAVMHWDGVKL